MTGKKINSEKILKEFIAAERKKVQADSDYEIYCEIQLEEYLNKQKPIIINLIEFVTEKIARR